MLNYREFEKHCLMLDLLPEEIAKLEKIWFLQPVRRGRVGKFNQVAFGSSNKMVRMTKAESTTVEYLFAWMFEYDLDIVEYWDQ